MALAQSTVARRMSPPTHGGSVPLPACFCFMPVSFALPTVWIPSRLLSLRHARPVSCTTWRGGRPQAVVRPVSPCGHAQMLHHYTRLAIGLPRRICGRTTARAHLCHRRASGQPAVATTLRWGASPPFSQPRAMVCWCRVTRPVPSRRFRSRHVVPWRWQVLRLPGPVVARVPSCMVPFSPHGPEAAVWPCAWLRHARWLPGPGGPVAPLHTAAVRGFVLGPRS